MSETEVNAENKDTEARSSKDYSDEDKKFQCFSCTFQQKYEYFGRNPPETSKYILLEDAYVMENPFLPPKQGKFIILGAHCVKCKKAVCKNANCSVFYEGTYCIKCAKAQLEIFPVSVREKIKKIVCV